MKSELTVAPANSEPFPWWARSWIWLLTLLWLGAVCFGLASRWEDVIALKPNEMGDLAAGVAAPLAFLWLVRGYMLQSRELELQRQELALQRYELKQLVAAQNRQAEEVGAQRELLERQEARREANERPLLHIRANGTSGGPRGILKKFTIDNTGGIACNVVVSSADADWHGQDRRERLNRGESMDFTLHGKGRQADQPNINISYEVPGGETVQMTYGMKNGLYRVDLDTDD